jgi:protein TonB
MLGVEGGVPGGGMSPVLRQMMETVTLPPPPASAEPARRELTGVEREVPQENAAPVRVDEFYPLKTIRTLPPAYPVAAKQARIQGTVYMELTLDETGTVESVNVVSGHPLLIESAEACVRKWVYAPPILNGKPVRVIIPVRINFRLAL